MLPINIIHLMKNNTKTMYFIRNNFVGPKNIYFSIPGEEKE